MENVKVKKTETLKILRTNRDAHQAIFAEAVDGYKAQVIDILEGHIADIKAGKVKSVTVTLPQPENHTKDYDRAIKMLEMSVDKDVTMDEHSFQCYVMDDWTWKRQFLSSNAFYSKIASDTLATM